jgi:hypothetical protein
LRVLIRAARDRDRVLQKRKNPQETHRAS